MTGQSTTGQWIRNNKAILILAVIILIGAFLGLGAGCLRADRGSLLWLWPTSLLTVVGMAIGMSRIAFTHQSVS